MTTPMNVRGCSTCPPGEERFEEFFSAVLQGNRVHYDYRTPGGRLYSTIAKSLEAARASRDRWLEEHGEVFVKACGNRLILSQEQWDRIHSTDAGKSCPQFEYCNHWINPKNSAGAAADLEEQRARNGGKLYPHEPEPEKESSE